MIFVVMLIVGERGVGGGGEEGRSACRMTTKLGLIEGMVVL